MTTDTIVAQATAPGRGGVGIVRVSGPAAERVAEIVLGKLPRVRYAEYLPFRDEQGQALDQGIALLFKAPTASPAKTCWSCRAMAAPSFSTC